MTVINSSIVWFVISTGGFSSNDHTFPFDLMHNDSLVVADMCEHYQNVMEIKI